MNDQKRIQHLLQKPELTTTEVLVIWKVSETTLRTAIKEHRVKSRNAAPKGLKIPRYLIDTKSLMELLEIDENGDPLPAEDNNPFEGATMFA